MPDPSSLDLVDLAAVLLVLAAAVTALRRGRGLLAALGSALGAAVVVWLAAVALTTWGPAPLADVAASSRLVGTVPVPQHAIDQAEQLLGLTSSEGNHR